MSEQDDRYTIPVAQGSIDNTLAGNAELGFGAILDHGWKLVSGSKLVIVLGFLGLYVALIAVGVVLALGLGWDGESTGLLGMVVQLAVTALIYPFMVGVLMVGVKQANGEPFGFEGLFGYYGKLVPLLIGYVLMTIATFIGFLLLVLPGIWLAVATMLTPLLIVEKEMSPVDALLTSIKLVNKKWFTVFFALLVVGLLLGLSMIPLGIGLIWTVPWSVMVIAVIYRQLAGFGDTRLA